MSVYHQLCACFILAFLLFVKQLTSMFENGTGLTVFCLLKSFPAAHITLILYHSTCFIEHVYMDNIKGYSC